MTHYLHYLVISCLLSLAAVRGMIGYLSRSQILDEPNERSSHEVPTPRGGGLAVMAVIFAGLGFLLVTDRLVYPNAVVWQVVMAFGVLLALVSWLDDRHATGIPARWRLLAQILAVALPLIALPGEMQILPVEMSPLVERVLIGLAWVWFINLYNFMDGINAITGVETVSISGGIVFLVLMAGLPLEEGQLKLHLLVIGATLGFLFWNARPHARVFLGDIGSIGLGYLLGWMLIQLVMQGELAIALLLPLVYVADTTLTLGKRVFRRKKIWEAHREHFYQQATHIKGLTHLQTAGMTFVINMLLVALACFIAMDMISPLLGLAIGVVLVKLLLFVFYKIGRRV